jgi:hypothetical protein
MLWTLLLNRYTIGLVVALGMLGGAYYKGYSSASAKCQDASLRARIASMERDMEAWKVADEVEKMLQGQLETEQKDLQDKVSKYEAELATRKEPKCTLDERDVRSINGLRSDGKR